jgi:DNA-binding phage protein
MGKTETSKKQEKSYPGLTPFVPDHKRFLDKDLIAEILVDALLQNDMDTFKDVIIAHLRAVSKTELAKKTGLGRQTIYDLMEKEKFDPRVSTLGALLSKIVA